MDSDPCLLGDPQPITPETELRFADGVVDRQRGRIHIQAEQLPVWRSRLPEGYVMLDEVRIEFPG